MKRSTVLLGVLLLGLSLTLACHSLDQPKGEPAKLDFDKSKTIKLPEGFVVELVAGPPLVQHPMMACFDDVGNLYVAEAAGQNLKADELLKNPPNLIRRLQDTNGDGKYDTATTFAEKMTFPMGVFFYRGSLYTASPPSLWRLRDTNGDGVADERTEIVTKFGFTGNAADIHGPFQHPSGWLYWCDGRHGHEITQPGGKVLKGKAARIFRCKPDGSQVEVVCGGGMDNPVEIAFTPEGEAIATVDIYLPRPRVDALIHCVEGGVFPYHEVYKEFRSTGGLLPAVAELGWVAPAGLLRYNDSSYGAGFQDNLFSAQFNRHRVQRHLLERTGATFRATMEDFLVSSDNDFHPTDLVQDADGSLLVIDTGGWFRIGCPTSQIAKPDIKGGIYRVRRKDAPVVNDPRGLAVRRLQTLDDLVQQLDDPRFAVRERAIEQVADQGEKALPLLEKLIREGPSVRGRRNAVWALTRMETPAAQKRIMLALQDKDASVRQAAVHALGLQRAPSASDRLLALVANDPDPAVRREAATALGRLKEAKAVPVLLEALRSGGDRFLEHAQLYALIEIADRRATAQGLRDRNPLVRRGALIALDQMANGELQREEVTRLLNTTDRPLQQAALAVLTQRPGWAREATTLAKGWLAQPKLDAATQESLLGVLLAFSDNVDLQSLIADTLRQRTTPVETRRLLVEVLAQATPTQWPTRWTEALKELLGTSDEVLLRQTLLTIQASRVPGLDRELLALAGNDKQRAEVRVAAVLALAERPATNEPALVAFLTERLQRELPALERRAVIQALPRLTLSDEQLRTLAPQLVKAGALELPHLLAAFESGREAATGKALLAALNRAPGVASVSADSLRAVLKHYPAALQKEAEPLLHKLATTDSEQAARLKELAVLLKGGDVERGRKLFFAERAACAACHRIKGEGGRIGPELTTIGAIRPDRDLLEAVVYPSASLARGFEPYVVTLKNGKTLTGVLAQETATAVVLVTADRSELRVPRADIDTMEAGKVSIMPQGLDAQLSKDELRDLLAYLQSLR